MNKYFALTFAVIFLLSFSFALSFPGKIISFKDLNMPTVYEGASFCVSMPLSTIDKDLLKNTPGVLGLLLHVKSGSPEDFLYVQSDLGLVYMRNIFGFNINHRHYIYDAQDNYIYVDLEPARLGNLDLFLCSSAKAKLQLYDDSQIGSYRIPYFGENNFTKSFKNSESYKINEKTTVEVNLKNSGYSEANVFLFYDNEIFTKWFKLKDGTPSLNQTIAPGESVNLEYNVVPLTGKSFTVSPAIVRYTVNGYVFSEYSNGLISNARAYLDEIFVTINIPTKDLDLNETGKLNILIFNDSDKNKESVLLVSGLEKFGYDDRYEITLGPSETKTMNFDLTSTKESIVTFNISMIAGDKEKTEKQYDSQTVSFGKEIANYNYIFVIVALVLAIGVAVYYKYGL